MISPIEKDMNRSRDVAGPELKRPFEGEYKMKDMGIHGSNPTGTISKHPLSELHHGDQESPLKALGMQAVVESHPMGRDMASHVPVVSKGSSLRENYPKGMGRSIAKKMQYAEKKKAGGY